MIMITGKERKEVRASGQCNTYEFDELISPLSRESFLSTFWGRSFVYLGGRKGRFASLLTWEHLSSILELHSLVPPRLRLVREDKPVDPNLFLRSNLNRSRLNSAGLINCLAEGATLIL